MFAFANPLYAQSFCPTYKRGGAGHAAILHTVYANYTILATQRGAMAQWAPPKYAPDYENWYLELSYLTFTNKNRQCKASTVYGILEDIRWQLDFSIAARLHYCL